MPTKEMIATGLGLIDQAIAIVSAPDFTFGYNADTDECEYSPRPDVHRGCVVGQMFPTIGEYLDGKDNYVDDMKTPSANAVACRRPDLMPGLDNPPMYGKILQQIQMIHDHAAEHGGSAAKVLERLNNLRAQVEGRPGLWLNLE